MGMLALARMGKEVVLMWTNIDATLAHSETPSGSHWFRPLNDRAREAEGHRVGPVRVPDHDLVPDCLRHSDLEIGDGMGG